MQWTIGGAIEHGSFLMALSAVLLTGIGILLVISGIIAYIRIKSSSKKIARKEAERIAREIAEREANLYLQAEMPALMQAYMELAGNAVSFDDGDRIASAKSGDVK